MNTREAIGAFASVVVLVALSVTSGVAADAQPRPAGTIVTIGDSIMSGHGLADGDDWPTLLAEADGLEVVNLSCSGAGFIAVGSCGHDYAGLVAAAAKVHPDVVVIESSSNDIGSSTQAIDQATASTVAAIRAALPHTRIVGLSTVWNDSSTLPSEIATSSQALREAVRDQHGRFVDVGQPLEGHPEWMQSDDVHPTLAGQEALVTTMRASLRAAGVAA